MKDKDYINKIRSLGSDNKEKKTIEIYAIPGSENEKSETVFSSEEGEIYLFDDQKDFSIAKVFNRDITTIDQINVTNELVDLLLGKTKRKKSTKVNLSHMPIASINILFKTLALVKNSQFSSKSRPQQLKLFEEEFKDKENIRISIAIDIKDISSQTTADGKIKGRSNKVREAVDFLQNNLNVWVTGKNAEGKTKETKFSFIESPSFDRKKLYFEMNPFWYEKLVHLSVYNSALLQLPKLLGNPRHVLFSLYLERFDCNEWKPWNFNNINNLFDLNYKNANDLAKGFMRELRAKLDTNSLKSFQYMVNGEIISIMPYEMKSIVNNNVELKSETLEKLENNHFANYIGRRHELSDEKRDSILDIMKTSVSDKKLIKEGYTKFKRFCRSKEIKKSILSYQGDDFINKWNTFIYEEYKKDDRYKNFPNGSPRI